jgi:CubicO group peptidase (beta-lactamase class C family)
MNQKTLDRSVKYIRSWLHFKYDREEVPGFVVAISHKGKIIFNEAYGYANLEDKKKLTTDHIFRIASHSKTFTATALMQLQEKGLLRIDDYASDYLDWLKSHKDKRWHRVTIRQLLSHGAGVVRDGEDADYWQLEKPFPSEEELKKAILDSRLVVENNTKLKYSNFGYSLLGSVVERVSGLPYNDYVKKHIVDVLKLTATGPEYIPSIKSQLVTGYTRRDVNKTRLPIAQIDTRAMSAATGFYSNTADLCTYFTAHFLGSGKLLDDESKKEMQRTQFNVKTLGPEDAGGYGLGFQIEQVSGRTLFGHSGGFPGHITKTMADPTDEIVVTVLTNCLGGPAGLINKGIYGIFDFFKESAKDEKSQDKLLHFEGRYMNLWGMVDLVVKGSKVVAGYPDSWQPLRSPEELEYVDDKTLKVIKTDSYSSEDELVRFKIVSGKVKTIAYTGSTMWPEPDWVKKQSSTKLIG